MKKVRWRVILILPLSAITGGYTLEVYTSNDVLLASKNFSVEEFVPDRIRINVKLDKTFMKPGESSNLSINATNFFGPPAANRNYETEIQVKQKYFSPEKFSGYDFSLANQNSFFDKVVKAGKDRCRREMPVKYTKCRQPIVIWVLCKPIFIQRYLMKPEDR